MEDASFNRAPTTTIKIKKTGKRKNRKKVHPLYGVLHLIVTSKRVTPSTPDARQMLLALEDTALSNESLGPTSTRSDDEPPPPEEARKLFVENWSGSKVSRSSHSKVVVWAASRGLSTRGCEQPRSKRKIKKRKCVHVKACTSKGGRGSQGGVPPTSQTIVQARGMTRDWRLFPTG